MSDRAATTVAPDSLYEAASPAVLRAAERRTALLLGLLLVGTLLKGVLWSQLVFPLDAPDEPSHFNYVMQVHSYHKLPQVFMPAPAHMVRPSTAQDEATRAMLDYYGFVAFRGLPYESTQPPLYYVTAALLITPLGEDRTMLMYAVRLVSVLFGVGAVWTLWLGLKALWPGVSPVVWGAPLALSLHPQFTFVTSTVTNDAASIFFGALIFAVWAWGLRAAHERAVTLWRWGLLAGLVTALGLLAKLTMIVTLPCTLLWLWWLASSPGQPATPRAMRLRRLVPGLLALGTAVLVLVGWWVVRNMLVYGEPTGTRAIFNLYHTVYWTRQGFTPGQLFSNFPPDDFALKTFGSFWASYGWVAALLLSATGLVGLVRAWRLKRVHCGLERARRQITWLSALLALLAFANMLSYVSFVDYQPQARYLFIALAPTLTLLVLGLRKATPRPAVNRALLWSLLTLLAFMQVLSIPALLDRWAAMSVGL
jgi:hypothetical protein